MMKDSGSHDEKQWVPMKRLPTLTNPSLCRKNKSRESRYAMKNTTEGLGRVKCRS